MTTICPQCGAELKSNPDCPRCRDAWTKALNEQVLNVPNETPRNVGACREIVSPGLRPPDALQVLFRNIYALTPHAYVTPTLIGINVAVFVLMVIFGVSPMRPTVPDLLRWGANNGSLVIDGQWWRTFTCMFVHVGFIHILLNMVALKDVGRLVERMVGNFGFLCMYLISGLMGSLGSLLWNPLIVSAGASGAVFGVFGCLVGILLRQRRSTPTEALIPLRNSGLAFVGFNLVFGAMIPNIDMSAHIGGLVGGFLCGLVLSQPFTPEALAHRFTRNLLTLILGVVLVTACSYSITRLHADIPRFQKDVDSFDELESRLMEKFNAAVDQSKKSELSDEAFSEMISQEILPDFRAGISRLETPKSLHSQLESQRKKIVTYAKLRQEAWELMAAALREGDSKKWAEAKEKSDLADDYARKF